MIIINRSRSQVCQMANLEHAKIQKLLNCFTDTNTNRNSTNDKKEQVIVPRTTIYNTFCSLVA